MNYFELLPLSIKEKIFDHLDWKSRIRAEYLCRDWKEILRKRIWSPTKNFTVQIFVFTPITSPESFTIAYNPGNSGNDINLHPIMESPNIKVCIVQNEVRFRLKMSFTVNFISCLLGIDNLSIISCFMSILE